MKAKSIVSVELLSALAEKWGSVWGIRDFPARVHFEFSDRLRTSYGKCFTRSGRIVLSRKLLAGRQLNLELAACHECAHAAAFLIFGPNVKPHGKEWRSLVSLAGHTPKTKVEIRGNYKERLDSPRQSPMYEHRCLVCNQVSFARRPVRVWRCIECVEAGLSGEMAIRCGTRVQRGARA